MYKEDLAKPWEHASDYQQKNHLTWQLVKLLGYWGKHIAIRKHHSLYVQRFSLHTLVLHYIKTVFIFSLLKKKEGCPDM